MRKPSRAQRQQVVHEGAGAGAAIAQGVPVRGGDQRAMVLQLGGSSTVTSTAFAAAQHCDLWNSISYRWLDINAEQLAQQVGVVRQ
ncbi:hypothetical protein [Amycolatopsis sp. cg9]|uniref:hypothetical protein n=1 Tax=Amycolatopsis sp. cg9 TaxID=3238801 RepID=UPI003523F7EF